MLSVSPGNMGLRYTEPLSKFRAFFILHQLSVRFNVPKSTDNGGEITFLQSSGVGVSTPLAISFAKSCVICKRESISASNMFPIRISTALIYRAFVLH